MALERSKIEEAFASVHEHGNKGEWNAYVDHFSDDCTFFIPVLEEPIRGRENLRAFSAGFPNVSNRVEWIAIDGNRLVCAWNTHHDTMHPTGSYRGISSYVFDARVLICEYEEWFDTAAHAASMKAPS